MEDQRRRDILTAAVDELLAPPNDIEVATSSRYVAGGSVVHVARSAHRVEKNAFGSNGKHEMRLPPARIVATSVSSAAT